MNSKKTFFAMIGALSLTAVALIGVVVFGDKLLSKQSKKLVDYKIDNQVIESQATALMQAKKDIDKYQGLEDIAHQIVPQDKDQALATREIISIAQQAGVSITSISFPDSNLGQTTPAPAAGSSTSTPAAPATSPITQAKPVTGLANVYQLDINVASDPLNPTTYPSLIDFLSRLEQNRRTAQVTQISIQPSPKSRALLSFTLVISVYIKPS